MTLQASGHHHNENVKFHMPTRIKKLLRSLLLTRMIESYHRYGVHFDCKNWNTSQVMGFVTAGYSPSASSSSWSWTAVFDVVLVQEIFSFY